MIDFKLRHLKQELGTWLRTLTYIQQENVYLKNSLADVIKDHVNAEILEQVEYFQNQFINKDTVILLLRYDVAKQYKMAEDIIELNIFSELSRKQECLRTDMEKMEQEFNLIKFQFNKYVATAI